jgi:hypothetical protein
LINENTELVCCEYKGKAKLTTDGRNLLTTSELMSIKNDRDKCDLAGLYGESSEK